jgi:hypothetical protein
MPSWRNGSLPAPSVAQKRWLKFKSKNLFGEYGNNWQCSQAKRPGGAGGGGVAAAIFAFSGY